MPGACDANLPYDKNTSFLPDAGKNELMVRTPLATKLSQAFAPRAMR